MYFNSVDGAIADENLIDEMYDENDSFAI